MSLAELYEELRLFGRTVWGERRMVARFTAITGLVGLFLAFASPDEFDAKTRVLPYRSGAGAIGGLSGLAGLAGIRLPAGAADQTITADLYPEVAKSQDFRIQVVETPVYFTTLGRSATTLEFFRTLYDQPLTDLLLKYTVGLPGEILAVLRPQRNGSTNAALPDSVTRLKSYDQKYMKLVRVLDKRIAVNIDKRTSIITITAMMPDPYAAADLVRVTSNLLMARIIDYESRKAGEQFRFVREQQERAMRRYEIVQRELASFDDRNRTLMRATAKIERDRLQREYDLAFEVYQQLSRELEQARLKMSQDTPAFTVLEQVTVPSERSSPQRARMILVSLFLGAALGVVRVGLLRLLQIA
ncbi:MAG: GNVR domain-containing protein [Gemmatimonadaceae bacterium]